MSSRTSGPPSPRKYQLLVIHGEHIPGDIEAPTEALVEVGGGTAGRDLKQKLGIAVLHREFNAGPPARGASEHHRRADAAEPVIDDIGDVTAPHNPGPSGA